MLTIRSQDRAVVDQASRKPTCPAAEMVATGMLEEIAQAPFDS
jgi:hypothetical protein